METYSDDEQSLLERAIRFGGMVLAHAALITSDLPEGELMCPFAIITKDNRRQLLPFEAETQEAAVENGKASLDDLRDQVDYWGFGREGLWSDSEVTADKTDVLVVSAWAPGMHEPAVLMQRFRPAATGQFVLIGMIEIILEGQMLTAERGKHLRALVREGISMHPSAVPWAEWSVH